MREAMVAVGSKWKGKLGTSLEGFYRAVVTEVHPPKGDVGMIVFRDEVTGQEAACRNEMVFLAQMEPR